MKCIPLAIVLSVAVPVAACSGTGRSGGGPGFGPSAGNGGSGSSGTTNNGGGGGGGGGFATGDGGFGSLGGEDAAPPPAGPCQNHDAIDHDGDGFSADDGDCNDCDPNTNPGAFDVPKDGMDEDCNGIIDDEPTGCDVKATLDSTDAYNAALAVDLCRKTSEMAKGQQRTWGVVDAAFVAPDGTDNCGGSCASNANFALGHGNLSKLGVNNPQQGSHMLALSSGTARDPTDTGYQNVSGFDKLFSVGPAPGYPTPAPACPGVTTGSPHDGAALRLVIRVPTNAQSFSFNSNFFSYEFPTFICSMFNDAFVVEMSPPPMGAGAGGNIAFDQSGNPISVNNALLQVCDPQMAGMKNFPCPLGSSTLMGTGFGSDNGGSNHAATGWLQTTVNIDPSLKGKDVTLLFAIWDSADGIYDSTAVIDNFQWSTMPGSPTPVTQPSPPPK